MTDFSASLKSHFFLSSSTMISSILVSAFWFILATILIPSDYGRASELIALALTGQAFASLGLANTLIVYGAKKENIFSTIYGVSLISATAVAIFIYILSQDLVSSLLLWGWANFVFTVADLTSQKKFSQISKLRILNGILKISLGLGFYFLWGVEGIIFGFFLASLPGILGLIKYFKNHKINLSLLKSKTKFIFNNYLSNLFLKLFLSGDKLLISYLFGLNVLGTYNLAFQYVLFLAAIPNSLFTFLLPNESEGTKNKQIIIFTIMLIIALVSLSFFIIPLIINSFLPNYSDSAFAMQIMVFGLIPMTISKIFEAKFLAYNLTKVVLLNSGIQTSVFFILIFILGSNFGLIGLAFAFIFATFIRASIDLGFNNFYKKSKSFIHK